MSASHGVNPIVCVRLYLRYALDGYYNDVTDKIVAFPTTYAWKMANYGKVHAVGVDATLAATVSLTEKIRLIVSADIHGKGH